MAIFNIPIRTDLPAYTQVTDLDGVSYLFTFRFNSRSNRWYMDIASVNGISLIKGVKILTEIDLIGRFKFEDLPPGGFFALDISGRGQQPDRLNFSNDVELYYIDEESVANVESQTS